ncbi:MAG: hypothetical protein ACQ9MH_20130, partial [Nitrospinales bacterium]
MNAIFSRRRDLTSRKQYSCNKVSLYNQLTPENVLITRLGISITIIVANNFFDNQITGLRYF